MREIDDARERVLSPVTAGDCKMRDSHEFMLRLICESGDDIKALQTGAA